MEKVVLGKKRGKYKLKPKGEVKLLTPAEDMQLSAAGGAALAEIIIDFFNNEEVKKEFEKWRQTPEGVAYEN